MESRRVSSKKFLTKEELANEQFFKNTYSRLPSGRFVVRFPIFFNKDEISFPGSFDKAKIMLLNLEKKFTKNPKLKKMNTDFFQD